MPTITLSQAVIRHQYHDMPYADAFAAAIIAIAIAADTLPSDYDAADVIITLRYERVFDCHFLP